MFCIFRKAHIMFGLVLFFTAILSTQASIYSMPDVNGLINDRLLRNILERMNSELADSDNLDSDGYLMLPSGSRRALEASVARDMSDKEVPLESPYDYEDVDLIEPKTSIRDQEYLQHSSLWSHQPLDNYKTNDRHKVKPVQQKTKDEKNDPNRQLPAYCTPPNPCPVGYTGENECIENFENTAAFSRDYQSAQDCMCDSEHMLECSTSIDSDNEVAPPMPINGVDFDQIVDRIQEDNPYFRGEKLPIAAKKGINVY